MRTANFYIALFFSFIISGQLSAQDDFEPEEYLETIQLESGYHTSRAHKLYLQDSVVMEPFDREKWERLRLNIVNEISGEEYEGQDGNSLTQEDNPYRTTQREFKRYWREKNSKKIKRLPKERELNRSRSESRDDLLNPGNISPFWSNLILILVVLSLAALVFFLFFNKMKETRGGKKIHRDLESIHPTEIPKTELELLLEDALAREDYREAVRVYFIFVIKGLVTNNMIHWEKEKTNFMFLTELRGNPLYDPFEKCVSVYEIVWYGERKLTKSEYEQLEPRFKNLVNELDE